MLWISIKAVKGSIQIYFLFWFSGIWVDKLLGDTSYVLFNPFMVAECRGGLLPRVLPAVIVVEAFQALLAVLEISAYVCWSFGGISGQVDRQPALAG